MNQPTLCRNDIWILQSMDARQGRQTSLVDVIAHADAVNHAIPVYAELCRAVFRLSAQGLIVADNEMFELSDSGRQLVAAGRGRNFLDANDRIAEYLGAGASEVIGWESEPPQEQRFVTRERFEQAVYMYRRRF